MKKTSRQEPFVSRIIERQLLTLSDAEKKVFHVVLEATDLPGSFAVGDSVGICPQNDPIEVNSIIEHLESESNQQVLDPKTGVFLNVLDFLTYKANLSKVSKSFLNLLHEKGSREPLLLDALSSDAPEKSVLYQNSLTVLDCVKMAKINPQELSKVLFPLLPRFYSIASSPKMYANEVHLLVAHVSYEMNGRLRLGVGSNFLCQLAEVGKTDIPMYIQPSMHFHLPNDPHKPMIMIGPGTGVAPFRAFMQERLSTHAKGKNWLIFGERHRKENFYYESFWTDLQKMGFLRLDLAFSRDEEEKVYVQHKIYENKKSFWQWLEAGAFVYVCGDAENMAKAVDLTIQKIIAEEGCMSTDDAFHYLKNLRREKRYLQDVY